MPKISAPTDFEVRSVAVAGVGDCTWDVLFRAPWAAPGASAPVEAVQECGGGLMATALAACARLGARSLLVARLGSDPAGARIQTELNGAGVETAFCSCSPLNESPLSFVHVDQASGERTIYWRRAFGQDPLLGIPTDLPWGELGCLLVDDRWPEAALRLAAEARAQGVPVLADLEPAPHNEALARLCDTIIAPAHWLQRRGWAGQPGRGLAALHALGASTAVITLGARGCAYSGGGATGTWPACPVEVVDTTGAGDAYHGAFAFGVAQRWPLEQRLALAAAVAALNCRCLGGRAGLPTLGEAVDLACGQTLAPCP